MTEVAFAPTWQRAPNRRVLVIAVLFALVLLGVASGPRLIVDFRDLRCPPGSVVAYVGPAYWTLACVPASEFPGETSSPISRSIVLSLNNAGVRVFAFDFLGGVYEGPASLR
jgi:hypothetical protein